LSRVASFAGEPLAPSDAPWALALAVASGLLFATTLPDHVAAGDSPVTVAGVAKVGILPAPGNPTYVILAHLFGVIAPIGSWALRMNLFSLVSAALAVAGVYVLARLFGALRWGAAVGALALATAASVWFYAGYAKHDAFSGLCFVATLLTAVWWWRQPSLSRIVALGVVVAIGIGSLWELEALAAPSVALVLFWERRRLALRWLVVAGSVGLGVLILVYGWVMVRAGQHPAVDWDLPDTPGRLFNLVTMKDFGLSGGKGVLTATGGESSGKLERLPTSVGVFLGVLAQEVGFVALAVAVGGAVVAWLGRAGRDSGLLLLTFLVSLLGTAVFVGSQHLRAFNTTLAVGGFLEGCLVVLAVWIALGVSALVAWAGRRKTPGNGGARWWSVAMALVAAIPVLAPPALENGGVADHGSISVTDEYAASALAELPHDAVLFVWNADPAFALWKRQILNHDRPDVVVVLSQGLTYPWYRKEVDRQLGFALPTGEADLSANTEAAAAIEATSTRRSTYLDVRAGQALASLIGYRPVGLVAAFAPGTKGPQPGASVASQWDNVRSAVSRVASVSSTMWARWPNQLILVSYATALLEVSRAAYAARAYGVMTSSLESVLKLIPTDPAALHDLQALKAQGL